MKPPEQQLTNSRRSIALAWYVLGVTPPFPALTTWSLYPDLLLQELLGLVGLKYTNSLRSRGPKIAGQLS